MDAMGFTSGMTSLRKIGLQKVEKDRFGGFQWNLVFNPKGETSDQIDDKIWRLISCHL